MGLKFPSKPATVEGSPKTPLPITEFTTSAVRLQRPMARTNCWLWETWGSVSGTGWFYHKWSKGDDGCGIGAGLRLAWTAEAAVATWF